MTDLSLDGTTVTLFGGGDAFDNQLSEELERRGCNTHQVTVPTGWLRSATHVVMRVDTDSGADALRGLSSCDEPRSHVIAVCAQQVDVSESTRFSDLCRACGAHHDVSLIWHPPMDPGSSPDDHLFPTDAVIAHDDLAAAIADEMAQHSAFDGTPSFMARP